jgi:hypothetical protein
MSEDTVNRNDMNKYDHSISELNKELSNEIIEESEIVHVIESDEISESEDFNDQERVSYIEIDSEFKKFLQNFVEQQRKKEVQKIILKYIFF